MAKYSGPAIENDAGLGQVRRAKRIHYLHKAELPTLRYLIHSITLLSSILLCTHHRLHTCWEMIRRSQPI